MQRSNARSHYVEVVIPAFEDFAKNYATRVLGFRRDTRLAGLAAGALRDAPEHIVPHLREHGLSGQGVKSLREQLCAAERAYQIACNFGDCWKHRELDRKDRLMNSLDEVQECIATTRFDDVHGTYYMSRKLVQLRLIDGTFVDVGRALGHALHFLSGILVQLQIIPMVPRLPALLPSHPKRGDSRYAGPIEMPGEVGEIYSGAYKCFVYRNRSDLSEPTKDHRFGTCDIPTVAVIRASRFDALE